MILLDMKRISREIPDTLEKNVVIPKETPFRVVSEENLHEYQEQVNFTEFIWHFFGNWNEKQ